MVDTYLELELISPPMNFAKPLRGRHKILFRSRWASSGVILGVNRMFDMCVGRRTGGLMLLVGLDRVQLV